VPDLTQDQVKELAQRLFLPGERWGWRFVAPVDRRPYLCPAPVWNGPRPTPDHAGRRQQAELWAGVLLVVGAGGLFLLAMAVALGARVAQPDPITGEDMSLGMYRVSALLGILAIVAVLFALTPWVRSVLARWFSPSLRLHARWTRYAAAWQSWHRAAAGWDEEERRRCDALTLWFPVAPQSGPSRVDVFGGTAEGWSGLLSTLGAGLLAQGVPVLVVDLSEEDVAGPLSLFAETRRVPCRSRDLPGQLEAARLLDGLSPEQVGELIAESVHTMRKDGGRLELQMLDAELIRTVAERLAPPVTFRRLSAGLQVLQQAYDTDRDQRLSATEVHRISDVIDAVVGTERAREEVQLLRSAVDLLLEPHGDESDAAAALPPGVSPGQGLVVIRTYDDNPRRRDFVDRLVVQTLLQRTARPAQVDGGFLLVVAGADHLGQPTLELLARRCRQAGIRLVLLMANLRDDARKLIGAADGATVFMTMGNAQEAAAAAEHIGRGHTFVRSQLTRTTSTADSMTRNQSRTKGRSVGRSRSATRGSSIGFSWAQPPNFNLSSSRTFGLSVTRSNSKTEGTSQGRTVTDATGETVARVYEFTVEPTVLQSLEPLSFLLVDAVEGERRVVLGNCDPFTALMARTLMNEPDRAELPDGRP
jgi:hypothetical protein